MNYFLFKESCQTYKEIFQNKFLTASRRRSYFMIAEE